MKTYVVFFFILLSFIGCNTNRDYVTDDDLLIEGFIQSNEFEKSYEFIGSFGLVNRKGIKVEVLEIDKTLVKYLMVPVERDQDLVGYLQVVDIQSSENKLPANERYAMNFLDLSKFNINSTSGQLKMYDLNYGNFMHSEVFVESAVIKKWVSFNLPDDLKERYRTTNRISVHDKSTLPCDENGDNNLGFTECYKCFSEAIESDAFARFICEIPVEGWITCFASKSVACVYLATVY